jgi:hypothetical protein
MTMVVSPGCAVMKTISAEQVMVGACLSLTVTANEQLAEFLASSVAVQLTVVVPLLNVDSEGGWQTGVSLVLQLSLAEAEKLTTAAHWFASVLVVMFAGQLIVGVVLSMTVTVKLQLCPAAVEQLTVVVPTAKSAPDGGVQVTGLEAVGAV